MLKKFITSILIFLVSVSHSLAGTGSSRPSSDDEEKSNRQRQVRSSSEFSNTDLAVTLGASAALALFVAYKMNSTSSSKDLDSSDEDEALRKNLPIKALQDNQVPSFSNAKAPIAAPYIPPTIDLSIYDIEVSPEGRSPEAFRFDLHPVYKNNPRKHLRQKIFELQQAYYLDKITDKMIRIITGTGKKRPGPNYRLRDNVLEWLQEPYIQRRIETFWIQEEGMINVVLSKHVQKEY